MATCPNKNLKEWKTLVKQVGENLADITYISYGYSFPDVKTTSEIKKELGFKPYVENLASISAKVVKYNRENGTSHYFTKQKAYGNTFKLELKLNYLPVNLEKQRQKQAQRNTIYRVEGVDTGAFSDIYGNPEPEYTPSPSEMEAGVFNDEGDFVPVDDASLYDNEDYLVDEAFQQVLSVEKQKEKALQNKLSAAITEYKKADNALSLRLAQSKIDKIKRALDLVSEQKATASGIKNYEGVLSQADEQLSELESLLQSGSIPYADILYGLRATNLWIKAGDNTAEPGQHIILDENERNTPEIVNAFALRRSRAETIQRKLNVITKDHITKFIQQYTSKNLTKEEMFKNLTDINSVAANTLNLGRTEDALLQGIFAAVETANKLARDEANDVWADLDRLGDKIMPKLKSMSSGNPFDVFKQVTENGKETGRMVTRFSAEYFDTINDLVLKAFHQKKDGKKVYNKVNIDKYFKFLEDNTINMDVRLLMPDALSEDSTTPEKYLYKRITYSETQINAHKAELKKQLGEKGYEKYLERLEGKIEKWKIQRDAMWESLNAGSNLDEKQINDLFEDWLREHSPYWGLDMADNPASRKKSDGTFFVPKGLRDYTYQIPRRISKNGTETKWYDKNFDKIEADEDLLEFHELITETLYEIKPILPKNKQKLLGINVLPTISKSIMDEYADKGMMMGVIPFWDKMKEMMTTTDLSETDSSDQDPLTGVREKHVNTQFVDDVNAKVRDIVKQKAIEFKQNNGKDASAEDLKRFREDAKDYLSKQKSWDLIKIMKAYSLMGLAYKHKSFIEPQIKLATQLFNSKKQIVQNKAGKAARNPNSTEPVITEEGLEQYKKMLNFFLASDFYSTGARDVEGVSEKKFYNKEEKIQKKKLEELLTNTEDPKEQEFLNEQIDALGRVVTRSGVGDTLLKYMTLKGLGWNAFSAFSNIGFGVISNVIEGADGRNYTAEQMRKAYILTTNSIGKNLTEYIPGVPTWEGVNNNATKIRSLMDQWDLMKTSNTELYKMSDQSTFSKGAKKFGPMSLQERSEYLNYAPTMIAVMMNVKATDPDGKEVNVWEAYDENGKIKEGYKIPGDESELVRKIRRVIEMNHGDYNNALMIKKTLAGRAVSQFRTWMFEGFANRFETEKIDYDLSYGQDEDYVRKGRYRSYSRGQLAVTGATVGTTILPGIGTLVGGAAGYIAGGMFGIKTEQNGISDTLFTLKQLARKLMFKNTQFQDRFNKVDAANMRKNMTELFMFVGLVGVTLALKAMIPDDDKEAKEDFVLNFLLNQSTRLQTDIAFYTSPMEFEKLTKTAVPMAQLIGDVTEWFTDIGKYFDDDPKNETFRSGPFKGESKALVHFGEILPGFSQGIRLYRTGTTLMDK